jgi:hypothetical protein
MPIIKLSTPWTYCTPLATIDFPAGEHEVSDEIAAAAPAQPEMETDDGHRIAAPRAPRRSRALEG